MPKIQIKFSRHEPLLVDIQDTNLGRTFCELLVEHRARSMPVYRDRVKYDLDRMLQLAHEAKQAFGWSWQIPKYTLADCVLLHKDLERLLGTTGYQDIDSRYDDLLTEMHYCLHIIQDPANIGHRAGGFQIEWFSDQGFPLPGDFEFQESTSIGSVELLNPWVGHAPMQIFNERDSVDINMTCKFHDYVKPGIRISTYERIVDRTQVLSWFETHASDFVNKHGAQRIMENTGWATVGRVINVGDFQRILADSNEVILEDFIIDV